MVKGRLPRESNPLQGQPRGYAPSFDTTGDEDYGRVSPENPWPSANYVQNDAGIWMPVSKDNPMPTQLTGSNVEESFPVNLKGSYRLDNLVNSVTVGAGENTGVIRLSPTDEMEIYLFVSIDAQPWSLRWRNQFGSVSTTNGFPEYSDENATYANNTPAIAIPLGYRPDFQGLPGPDNVEEAKRWRLPLTPSEYFILDNKSNSPATVNVDVLRVWR